jgi:DNA invertase Pin-like site-specific DNA recombinase
MTRTVTRIGTGMAAMPVRKRVAAYARVSSGKDAMLHSLAAQVSHYSALIQQRPEWEYAGVYADEALTGTKDSRAEFQRLVADCRAGLIDMVITKSISRFARNTVTLLETVRELKALGIGVRFEEQGIDTLTADGELMLTILASYAQEESRSASENQKWRVRKSYKEGKPTNHIKVYGYEYDSGVFTVIPEEAEVVRMIFADYLSGLGVNAIMRKLVKSCVPTKLGGRWSEGAVSAILANEKYIGDTLLQKKYVADHMAKRLALNKGHLPQYYVEGTHESIVDRETFAAVQAERERRAALRKMPSEPVASEFSGIIICGRCGSGFKRQVTAAGTKYARRIWICRGFSQRGKGFCPAKRIREDILMEKCAEALGLAEHDAAVFTERVERVVVPEDGVLTFRMKDGTEKNVLWENPSRRDSWTEEMREAVRRRRIEEVANGKC